MNVSLYQAASALNANLRWQEVISENLASSAIPGFKKREISFSAVQGGSLPSSTSGQLALPQSNSLPRATIATSFQPGEMKPTDVKTDLAIEGSAFFEVQLPNGNPAYTRDGEFQVDAHGQLVTKEGYPVMSDSGPIQFDLNNPVPMSVSPNGEVSQGPDLKGKLKLVEFTKPQLLTQVSGGYFIAQDPNLVGQSSTTSTVRQGYLEGANTTTVAEMANLLSALRTFEANQRIIQLQDDRMARTISELGNPS
jgi:flagellar basal-body rod protein FlgF